MHRSKPAPDKFFHYLPVGKEQVAWGTFLTGAGRGTVLPGEPYPAESHPPLYAFNWRSGRTLPDFQILLLQGGKGVFESKESGVLEFDSAVLLFLFPDVWHRYRPDPSSGWNERWISFNGKLVHRFFDSQQVTPQAPVFRVTKEMKFRLEEHYDELLKHIHERPVENTLLYSFLTMGLIANAFDSTHTLPLASDPVQANEMLRVEDAIVSRALEIIWTHSNRPLSIEEIANQLPVTRRTLDRRFVEATGHTVLEEINRCRLARAKRLLRETKLPIKALAHLAGFASQERLRVSFLASEGISPSAFRAKNGYQDPKQP